MAKDQAEVKKLLKRFKLGRHEKLILGAIEPAYAIQVVSRPRKTALPVGRSKFGGLPHLPAKSSWPTTRGGERPLQFLGQINFAELPPHPAGGTDLPDAGLLSLWYDQLGVWVDMWANNTSHILQPDSKGGVIFTKPGSDLEPRSFPSFEPPPGPKKSRQRFAPPAPFFGEEKEYAINLKPVLSLERDAMHDFFDKCDVLGGDSTDENEWTRALDFVAAMEGKQTDSSYHRLLGSEYQMMSEDVRVDAATEQADVRKTSAPMQYVRPVLKLSTKQKRAWVMLVRLGSDDRMVRKDEAEGWLWGDGGQLAFMIRRTDLKQRRFSKAVSLFVGGG